MHAGDFLNVGNQYQHIKNASLARGGISFFFVMKNRDEKIGIRKFGNRWVDKGEIHTVPAALPLLLLPDNEAAFFIRINGQG